VRKCIILFLITGILWAQTAFDKLVYKDGRKIFGEYLKQKRKIIYFKREGPFQVQKIHINIIESLKLKDGIIIINDGKVMGINSSKNIELATEIKAVYDAEKDAKKWLGYPPLGLISAAGLATTTFFIGEGILDMSDEIIFFGSIFGGFLGLVGSYRLFSKLDKKNLEIIKTEDIESYGKRYSREYEARKLKNIVIGSGILGLTAVVVADFMFKDFMTDYDPYFGP
tara:strand:+ start:25 stop:702 length:678 start_codon:yes stop_codon:yes gene_type:complete